MKIALLYLCSGEYRVLWDDYYKSFMENFLPDCEKDFYVFTDAKNLTFEEKGNVFIKENPYVGWPEGSLKRFELFLSIEDELNSKEYSHTFFCNANLRCVKKIHPEDIGINDSNVELIFAKHPAYVHKAPWRFPYDRNPRSKAYIPYNCGDSYVMGAFNGGRTGEYLNMARTLNNDVCVDESNNVMAKVFDESYLNHYAIVYDFSKVKVLSSLYCGNYLSPQDKIYLLMVNKSDYFDEDGIKKRKKRSNLYILGEKVLRFSFSYICFIRDSLLNKHVVKEV